MSQPVNRPPETPVQRALVARLRGDATLAGLLAKVPGTTTPAIVDEPVEGQPKPYVRLGDHLSIAANDLTSFGRQVTETIHVWTEADSNGPGQAIADRIVELLDHRPAELAVAGHRVVSIRWEFGQALSDPDPQIRHHVLRFRIETAQED